jgi:hypothetical protein
VRVCFQGEAVMGLVVIQLIGELSLPVGVWSDLAANSQPVALKRTLAGCDTIR